MKPKTMHRLSLSIWAAAAATTALKEVIPKPLHPLLKLGIPAAVTSSILAGIAAVLAAQDRHAEERAEAIDRNAALVSAHLNQLVTQVTEISKSDHDRLAYLRGLLANTVSNGAAFPNDAPVHL